MILSAADFKCRFCDARYELLLFLNKKTKHHAAICVYLCHPWENKLQQNFMADH